MSCFWIPDSHPLSLVSDFSAHAVNSLAYLMLTSFLKHWMFCTLSLGFSYATAPLGKPFVHVGMLSLEVYRDFYASK